ncbi:MAG: ABC transporter substrate-binding protein [Burkholderiales bacterium]|nr:ABC transporter substrate-binding protein [Burkholderiales bacterium]
MPVPQRARNALLACLLALTAPCCLATELELLTEENPPLNYSENGQPKGLSVDVVREIQRRIGNHDAIKVQPWARAYRTASTTPHVALFGTARTAAREEMFQWVGPVATAVASLYGKRGSGLHIASLEDAKSAGRILVVRDFYTHQMLEKLGFTNLELVPKPETMVKMAVNGRAPLMFVGNLTLPDLLEKAEAKRSDVELLYTVTSIQTYIAFSLGTPKEIVSAWQAALDGMKRDGSYAAIYAKWLPGETPTKIKPDPAISPY